jgi:hypothetical protein
MNKAGFIELNIRIDAYGQSTRITEVLDNDWLTSEFDRIWAVLGSKLKAAMEEAEAAKKISQPKGD